MIGAIMRFIVLSSETMQAFYQHKVLILTFSLAGSILFLKSLFYFPPYFHIFVIGQLQNYSNEQLSKQIQSFEIIFESYK
jgi:hypothetical protein